MVQENHKIKVLAGEMRWQYPIATLLVVRLLLQYNAGG